MQKTSSSTSTQHCEGVREEQGCPILPSMGRDQLRVWAGKRPRKLNQKLLLEQAALPSPGTNTCSESKPAETIPLPTEQANSNASSSAVVPVQCKSCPGAPAQSGEKIPITPCLLLQLVDVVGPLCKGLAHHSPTLQCGWG